MTNRLGPILLLCALTPGCFTARLLESSRAPRDAASAPTVEGLRPVALVRAVRGPDGVIHLETRFEELGGISCLQHHVLDPAPAPQPGAREPWPSAAGRLLEAKELPLVRRSGAPWPEAGVPLPIVSGGAVEEAPAFALRFHHARLELSDGAGRFHVVAGYPVPGQPDGDGPRERSALALALVLPATLLLDAALLPVWVALGPSSFFAAVASLW